MVLSLQAALGELFAVVIKALYCELKGFHGIYVGAALFTVLVTTALVSGWARTHLLIDRGNPSLNVCDDDNSSP